MIDLELEGPRLRVLLFLIYEVFLERALTSVYFLLFFKVLDDVADCVPSVGREDVFHSVDGIDQSGLCLFAWIRDLIETFALDWTFTEIALCSFRSYKGGEYLKDTHWTVSLHAKVLIQKVEGSAAMSSLNPARDVLGIILLVEDCVNNHRKIESFNLRGA